MSGEHNVTIVYRGDDVDTAVGLARGIQATGVPAIAAHWFGQNFVYQFDDINEADIDSRMDQEWNRLNHPNKKNGPAELELDEAAAPTKGTEMNTTIVAPATEAPLAPIYGPSDPRWSVLLEWLEANHHTAASITDMSPTERAEWVETHVNGADFVETSRRDFVYPEIPAQPQPVWAEGFDEAGYDVHDRPTRLWFGDLVTAENVDCTVNLTRNDVFDPETNTIIEGDVAASLWLDGDMHESRIPDPSALREIALTLYDAATKWEGLRSAEVTQ